MADSPINLKNARVVLHRIQTHKNGKRMLDAEGEPSTQFPVGSVVMGKLQGHSWWPGMVIEHTSCGMAPPSEKEQWLVWFGDYRVSKVATSNIVEFDSSTSTKKASKGGKKYELAMREAQTEYERRVDEEAPQLPNFIIEALKKIKERNLRTTTRLPPVIHEENIIKLKNGELSMEGICLGCCVSRHQEQNLRDHPLFMGSLCRTCADTIKETMFSYEDEGIHIHCCVCGNDSEREIVCSNVDCGRTYCNRCKSTYAEGMVMTENWLCDLCQPREEQTLLRKQNDWKTNVVQLFGNIECEVPCLPTGPKKPLRVLSLFDGLATGLTALLQLGINVEIYYTSEVDKNAMNVSTFHYHSLVTHLGDVRDITEGRLRQIGPIDLLIGGSPCKDLSYVNPARKGLYDCTGTGVLFFEFIRILNILQVIRQTPVFWLFENVTNMSSEFRSTMSRFFEREPVLLDAEDFSAQRRARLFWTNIPGAASSRIPATSCILQDILKKGFNREATRRKLLTITTSNNCMKDGEKKKGPVLMDGVEDVLWMSELEEAFGLPPHYTDVGHLSLTKRRQLLGRSWVVPVISHLFKPLCSFYQMKKNKCQKF